MIIRLADPIVHQTQPTPCSCTQTCVAMAVGRPVESLGFNLEDGYSFRECGVWFAERGIWMRVCDRKEPFRDGRVYLASVRSLNMMGMDHAVLVDTRGEKFINADGNEESGWLTFDPCKGREGKKHYPWVDEYYAIEACELVQHDPRYGRLGSPPA